MPELRSQSKGEFELQSAIDALVALRRSGMVATLLPAYLWLQAGNKQTRPAPELRSQSNGEFELPSAIDALVSLRCSGMVATLLPAYL